MDPPRFYAVIFDAGSSGTRIYIYRIYRKIDDGGGGVLQRPQVVEIVNHDGKSLKKQNGGIHESDVAAHLGPLFADAARILQRLDPVLPIKYYVYATGGVRGMPSYKQEELRKRVRDYIEGTQRIARTAYEYKPIIGTDEAKYGWVAAHRSIGRLYDAGYVEMGGATAQIVFPLPDDDKVTATATDMERQLSNVRVEYMGHQKLFLASYPLGTNEGYNGYIKALFTKGESIGLTTGEFKDGKKIFYDPAKRIGSPEEEVEGKIIRFRPDEGLVDHETNLYKTFLLTGFAVDELAPEAAITEPLDSVIRKLDFIGASNFWHSLKVSLNDEGHFKLSTLYPTIFENRKITYAQMNAILAKLPPKNRDFMRPIYTKSIFTTRWTLRVLRQAFGVLLMDGSGKGGKDLRFTPYDGSGNGNDLSWTLGAAVLLASHDAKDLKPAVAPIRA